MDDFCQVPNRVDQGMRFVWPKRDGFTRLLFSIPAWVVVMCGSLVTWSAYAVDQAALPTTSYPVGMTQIEYSDPTQGDRPLNYMLIYPAASDIAATPFKVFLSTKLRLYKDAPIVTDGLKHPLVVFSHGAGGNGSGYAWFGQYLASHGYLVAMVYHYRANTFDSSALYVRYRLATPARCQFGHHSFARGQNVGTTH